MADSSPHLTLVAMAADSLRRLARLATASLDVSTLAIYMTDDDGEPRRIFALDDYPEPSAADKALLEALPDDIVTTIEAADDHPALAEHPWVAGPPGWKAVASAPLVMPNPRGEGSRRASRGRIVVADTTRAHFDKAAKEQLADVAALAVERLELQQSQAEVAAEMDRMITIGILAAGVAHEINNPLSFVGGNIQFALRLLADDIRDPQLDAGLRDSVDEIVEALEDALVGSRRVHEVVRDLHRLAGGSTNDDFTIEQISVLAPLSGSLNIARKHIEQRAVLSADLREVAPVMGNESKLGQVFLNLLINAAQAIPKGGVEGNEVRVQTSERDGDVVISISDTGTGIAQEDLAHIFEPFFTTKPRSEGSGLGLAISHNIVTSLGGSIELDTAPGEGTTVRVVLPSAAKMIESASS